MSERDATMKSEQTPNVRAFRAHSGTKSPQLILGLILTGFVVAITIISFFGPHMIQLESMLKVD